MISGGNLLVPSSPAKESPTSAKKPSVFPCNQEPLAYHFSQPSKPRSNRCWPFTFEPFAFKLKPSSTSPPEVRRNPLNR